MRHKLLLLCMLLGSGAPAMAQVNVDVDLSIGIDLSAYPQMTRVPGYPVYYASDVNSNLFFYDGMYWAYQDDNWYASDWYNGPWDLVSPDFVPLYVLRVPVRYYRAPPVYFRSWSRTAAPHWDQHWGNQWAQRRSGWDHWNRNAAPAPAPLPDYQRQYAGSRYPRAEQQQQLHSQNYRYRPRDAIVHQRMQEQATPAPRPGGDRTPQDGNAARHNLATPRDRDEARGTRGQHGQSRDDDAQKAASPRQAGPGNPDQRPPQQLREPQVQAQPRPQAQPQVQPQAQPQAQPRPQEQRGPVQREQGDRGQENRAAPAEQGRGQGRGNENKQEREGDGGRGQQRDRGNN